MYKVVEVKKGLYSNKFAIIKKVSFCKWRFIKNHNDRLFTLDTYYAATVYINQVKKLQK